MKISLLLSSLPDSFIVADMCRQMHKYGGRYSDTVTSRFSATPRMDISQPRGRRTPYADAVTENR
jgi:hypothetical protein